MNDETPFKSIFYRDKEGEVRIKEKYKEICDDFKNDLAEVYNRHMNKNYSVTVASTIAGLILEDLIIDVANSFKEFDNQAELWLETFIEGMQEHLKDIKKEREELLENVTIN